MVQAVNHVVDPGCHCDREFTPSDADQVLPLLKRIAQDMMQLQASIDFQEEKIGGLDHLKSDQLSQRLDYADELDDIRRSLDADRTKMAEHVVELAQLGVRSHGKMDGYFDFPARLGRRSVCLCWHVSEPSVAYWHELEASPSGRSKVGDESFEGEGL